MSQSPVNDFSGQATLRYKQGWRALNRLLHEDRSFSGNERDCAFLNCGGDSPSFATVSNVTGFDFPDDGRGLATVDWDFDGDLDVWLTARTAPRVRFLKNNAQPRPFVAFKLRGDGILANRDAIGARLELHLRGSKHPVRIRTLRGGEGFLSQSSNWLHFGLGDATGIEKLVIRWPGGKPQEITGLEAGKFYRILAGKGAEVFTPPAGRQPLTPSESQPAALDESARIVVPPGLPLPQLTTITADGTTQPWEPKSGRPTVINIWASWCAPCIAELTEWAAHEDAFTAAGVDIVAFNTDSLGENTTSDPTKVAALGKKFSFSLAGARLHEQGLHALDHLQRSVLDRWKPLPLPATFLADGKGELIAIYKGSVTSAQLLADLKLSDADPSQRRAAAIPFPGRWVDEKAGRADPQRVASLMLDHDEADAAIEYLDRCIAVLTPQQEQPGRKDQLGDIYYMAGLLQPASSKHKNRAIASLTAARDLIPVDLRIRKALAQELFGAGRAEEAAAEMLAAVKINSTDLSLKADLADLYERSRQFAKARAIYDEFLAANPKDAPARYRLAGVLVSLNDPRAAIQQYKQTLSDSPRTLEAANALARLLAGHPDDAIRSPDEALMLTQRLCSATKEKNPDFLDSLALALANKGQYPEAVAAAQKAISLLPANSGPAGEGIKSRLKLYQSNQPWRSPASPP